MNMSKEIRSELNQALKFNLDTARKHKAAAIAIQAGNKDIRKQLKKAEKYNLAIAKEHNEVARLLN